VEGILNDWLMQTDENPNSETADLTEMHQLFMQLRNAYLERKKIRDLENYIVGA